MFFDFIGLKGTFEEKAKQFTVKGRDDTNWAFYSVMQFISYQKERADRNEISESSAELLQTNKTVL